MNTPSAFQRKFPLSQKKFWKKIIEQIPLFSLLVFPFALGMAIVPLLWLKNFDNLTPLVLTFFLSGFILFFALVAIYGLYVDAYIRRYYYDVDQQLITIRKGVFTPKEIHVPFNRIQDVYVDQDLLDRLLGIYDVHIASATYSSGLAAHIDGVDASVAEPLKTLLLNRLRMDASVSTNTASTMPLNTMQSIPAPANTQISPPEKGKFNSTTFPIDSRWLVVAFFKGLLHAVYTLGIFTLLFFRNRSTDPTKYFSPLIWTLAYVVLFIVYFVRDFLWQMYFSFDFSEQYILVREGIISRSEKHVPYRTIQDVSLSQGFIERLFGLCSVTIENAAAYGSSKQGSKIVLPGQPLDKGNILVAEINRIIRGATTQSSGL